jgi:hypothetical protein
MLCVELRVRGHLDSEWSTWLADLTVEPTPSGDTILSGWVEDEAALYGLISKLRDLGLALLSVNTQFDGDH